MTPIKQTITVELNAYARNETRPFEIDATVIGDLAVHKPVYWFTKDGDPSQGKGWTISHVPSGKIVASAVPQRLQSRGTIKASQKDLIAFATAWQTQCPDFFGALRDAGKDGLSNIPKDVSLAALSAARSL
jgi:hypothetical protein